MVDESKRQRVLDAAMELFMHFGFARTTMGDIAKDAGMSRPTLYALFENKDEVFAAVLDNYSDKVAAQMEDAARTRKTLGEKLQAALEVGIVQGYEYKRQFPRTQELLELADEQGASVVDEAYTKIEACIARCISSTDVDLKPLKLSASKLAKVITTAARGMKDNARDVKELRQMLAGLVALVARAV